MITSTTDKVVRGYYKEVCAVLGMGEENVRLLYVSQVDSKMGIPQFTSQRCSKPAECVKKMTIPLVYA